MAQFNYKSISNCTFDTAVASVSHQSTLH